ncbi:hypothetical protein Sru01_02190 [Sphaerisporangium rufum]|uniref:histidine kinase n=1 Tax=Sphaerisporangium rufum TaxID=1381558 RepID=A0A919UYL6_9ACTN|nr:hypothetical protein Sru01_02190 [Sphaerisporangium rufum]
MALVCGMAVLVVGTSVLAYGNQPAARPLDPAGYALLLAAVASLAWLPSRPDRALAGSVAAAVAYFASGYAYALWPAPALVATSAAISSGRRAVGWAGAGVLVAVPVGAVSLAPRLDGIVGVVLWTSLVLVVTLSAEVSRTRRAYVALIEERAAAAERDRAEEALRLAQEERLKVARELHDVTSHTVSVIALHAAVAAEAVDRAGGPPEAAEALLVIRRASREALAEMKAVLGVLRPGGTRPQPGSAELPELLATATVPVAFETTGARRPLPPAVDLTVYRVVQEALTNTMRHAAASRVTVALDYAADAVEVRIDDDGRGGDAPWGHGLTGMAERVGAAGGEFSVGERPGGGFRVAARLPAERMGP